MNRNEFEKELERVSLEWSQKSFGDALDHLSAMLGYLSGDMKCQCLLFRGLIKQDLGFNEEARNDWNEAIEYSLDGSYLRYSLQTNLGDSHRNGQHLDAALKWYRLAIMTCSKGEEFSGSKSLAAFLEINDYHIPTEDKLEVARALRKSWRVLNLPGEPKLEDLPNSILYLNSSVAQNISKIVEDS